MPREGRTTASPSTRSRGELKTYYRHILAALAVGPHMTMDDGRTGPDGPLEEEGVILKEIFGGTGGNDHGRHPLEAMAEQGVFGYSVVAVNEAETKHLFDNRYGTGQSTLDGILRATNPCSRPARSSSAGYGWCGRGSPCGPGEWAPACSSPRSTPSPRSRRRWTAEVGAMETAPQVAGPLLHRDREPARSCAEHFAADERRGARLQLRPLQRRDRHPRPGQAVEVGAQTSGRLSTSTF